jgi:hypothetical protein
VDQVVLVKMVLVVEELVEQELYVQFQLADQHLIQLQSVVEEAPLQMVMFQL